MIFQLARFASAVLGLWDLAMREFFMPFHEKAGVSQAGFMVLVEWSSMELFP